MMEQMFEAAFLLEQWRTSSESQFAVSAVTTAISYMYYKKLSFKRSVTLPVADKFSQLLILFFVLFFRR